MPVEPGSGRGQGDALLIEAHLVGTFQVSTRPRRTVRKLLLLALVLAATAACGAEERIEGGAPASTVAAEEPQSTSTIAEEQDEQRPPPFSLVSEAGRQIAVQSTYCITGPSVGTCADYVENGPPKRLSVVRPGETVQLVFAGAKSASGDVSVVRLGCRKQLSSVKLDGPTTSWAVDLEPGSYELEVFAVFETASTSGDTSASLGLLVDESAAREIIPAPKRPDCPQG